MITSEKSMIRTPDNVEGGSPSDSDTSSPPWGADIYGGNKQTHLWHFLLEMLAKPDYHDIICWDGDDGEFVIKEPHEVARLWGERKRKPAMNYEKLGRALRYYYGKRILEKCKGKRYAYQFNAEALRVMLQRTDQKSKESIDSLTEIDLSDDREEKMIEEKPYTNHPFINQINHMSVLNASDKDAAATKRRHDTGVKPVRPIPVLPGGFHYPSASFEKGPKNIILPPPSFAGNPLSMASASLALQSRMNVKNLNSLHQSIQAQKSWEQSQQRAHSQLYEAVYHQLGLQAPATLTNAETIIENQGRRFFTEKDLLSRVYHKNLLEQRQKLLSQPPPLLQQQSQLKIPETKSKRYSPRHQTYDMGATVDSSAFAHYRSNHSPQQRTDPTVSTRINASGQKSTNRVGNPDIFSFGQEDIEAYKADLGKKLSRQPARQTRYFSENTAAPRGRAGRGVHPEEPKSAFPTGATSKQDVPMMVLSGPTIDELRSSYKGFDKSRNGKLPAVSAKQGASPTTRYIALTRPDHHKDFEKLVGSTGKNNVTSSHASALSPRHSDKTKRVAEKPMLRRPNNDDTRGHPKDEREQTEPLNLSCPKMKIDKETSQPVKTNFLHVPSIIESPGRYHGTPVRLGLSPSSPLRPSSISSPRTPYSPMRNLHISDSCSPVPSSPSRKRQSSSSIKMSLSSNDLMDSANPFERLEQESSSKAKLGRYTCKSETHAKRNLASDKQFSFDSWWHNQQDGSHLLNPNCIKNASASLPCSPNHQMPPKWRFKHRKPDENANVSHSEPLTPEIKHGMRSAQKRHSDAINYDDKFTITQSRDNTLEAYQNDEQLIVISNELPPEDEFMDTTEDQKTASAPKSKRGTMKIFRTPSEEISEINEGRLISDDGLTLKHNTNKCSLPPPIIRVETPSQHELKEENRSSFNAFGEITSENSVQRDASQTRVRNNVDTTASTNTIGSNTRRDVMFETKKESGTLVARKPDDELLLKPFVLRRQDASSLNPAEIASMNHGMTIKAKKSSSLRSVSGNFIKAILSTRDKAHSCPPVPTSDVGFAPLR